MGLHGLCTLPCCDSVALSVLRCHRQPHQGLEHSYRPLPWRGAPHSQPASPPPLPWERVQPHGRNFCILIGLGANEQICSAGSGVWALEHGFERAQLCIEEASSCPDGPRLHQACQHCRGAGRQEEQALWAWGCLCALFGRQDPPCTLHLEGVWAAPQPRSNTPQHIFAASTAWCPHSQDCQHVPGSASAQPHPSEGLGWLNEGPHPAGIAHGSTVRAWQPHRGARAGLGGEDPGHRSAKTTHRSASSPHTTTCHFPIICGPIFT